jgi:hypothetical protein
VQQVFSASDFSAILTTLLFILRFRRSWRRDHIRSSLDTKFQFIA